MVGAAVSRKYPMTTAGPDRFRKAALALHGLSRRDRAWLLRRLSPSMRAPLQSLLRQLRGLGIAPDVRPDESALPPVEQNVALDAAQVALVDAAGIRWVTTVMAGQAEQLQAVLLDMHPWRWRAEFWDGLSAFQRTRMAELSAAAPKPRPAMLDALLHGFATVLSAGSGRLSDVGVGGQYSNDGVCADAARSLLAAPGAFP
jgi:hypothetical protein